VASSHENRRIQEPNATLLQKNKLHMKKIVLILFLLSINATCYCQSSKAERQAKLDARKLKKIVPDTLVTKSGYPITVKQEILIGVGSTPDGDFKFIRRNSSSLFAYYSTTGYQGQANAANAFPRNQSGYKYAVKTIERRGDEKHGYVNYIKIGSGMINYEIDIENAIAFGEVVIPDQFKTKEKNVPLKSEDKTFSVSDELIKLKKLLDEGVLTNEEFDSQKKKLLEK
jgi:hypothetical protein